MITRMYYNDYFYARGLKYEKECYNIVRTPCGSGKTFHCLDIILGDSKFEKDGKKPKCLYVTDTSALREAVMYSYYKASGVNVADSSSNLSVITYNKFSRNIAAYGDYPENYFKLYDYIFLDEIHQLFIYSNKYDTDKDERQGYNLVKTVLPCMSQETTLICLSATPEPLFQYIRSLDDYETGSREAHFIKDMVPIRDLRYIKSYSTKHTIPCWSLESVLEDIVLEDNDKLFIFARTIKELRMYENLMKERGYTTTTLWSDKYNKTFSDDPDEQDKIDSKRMTTEQMQARDKLIQTGEYNTQVLILNGAYESGINIENGKDSKQGTIHVFVASTDKIQIEQARGRIRHDIEYLYELTKDFDYLENVGEENNVLLCNKLEELTNICNKDVRAFVGKEGLRTIANTLNIWGIRAKSEDRYQKTSVKSLNEHFLLLNLPYEIESCRRSIRVDGKPKKLTFYTVVKTEQEE